MNKYRNWQESKNCTMLQLGNKSCQTEIIARPFKDFPVGTVNNGGEL